MRIPAVLFIFFFSLYITADNAQAQFNQLNSFDNPAATIVLQPDFPKPGESVTATLSDYQGAAYGASIAWFMNGQEIIDAKNQREVKFTAGSVDVPDNLTVVLTSSASGRIVAEAIITPVYLDIVIEPQTRVPTFYQGRALPSLGSIVNATALINGQASNDLVYIWRVDQKVLENGPIRGRNQVSFTTPMGSSVPLHLSVTRPDGTVIARRSILLPSVSPTITFYEVNTLFGINHRAVTRNYNLISQSATIQAEPYYLDSRVFNNPDIKEWKINNRTTPNNSSNPYQITLQRAGATGVTRLEFHVRDLQQVLQGAKETVAINY
jgi:hypothetical protein